ncbi:MAG: hypothetical protein LBS91_03030 [Clostridiales Family XIII bacterium]|jgi:hypothetical protein|nr:hypothetical protein [Clostridiales Family XIII bacterium]
MAKEYAFKPKKCKGCGCAFTPGGSRQQYCRGCRPHEKRDRLPPPEAPRLPHPGDYAKAQVAKTAALLKEYGTADLAAVGRIRRERAEAEAEARAKTGAKTIVYLFKAAGK